MRRLLTPLLCVLALTAVAGCGGDDDEGGATSAAATTTTSAATSPATTATTGKDDTTTPSASKASFLDAANQICREYNRDVRKLQRRLATAGEKAAETKSFKAYEPVLRDAVEASQETAQRFVALQLPASEKAKALAVAKVMGAQTNVNNLLYQSAVKDDGQQFTAASQALQEINPKLAAVQRGLGMKEICGSG
jgi:hypothetical protein